jgi:hypothetical protein
MTFERLAAVVGMIGAVLTGTHSWTAAQALSSGAEPVTYHDFAAIPLTPVGAMQARAFLAATSGVAMGVMPAGMRQAANHHQQEQITLCIEGTFDMVIGGVTHTLSNAAALVPSNVEHPMVVMSDRPATMLEYQAVLRTDWLPPHARLVLPQSPEPMAVPADRRITLDFASGSAGWKSTPNGARSKSISGATIRATFWDLSKLGAGFDVTAAPSTRERLVYVLSGRARAVTPATGRDAPKDTLVVVPPTAGKVAVESRGEQGTLIVVFEVTQTAHPPG